MKPTDCLNELMKKFPDAGKNIYQHRMTRGTIKPKWPAWCFLPHELWHEVAGVRLGDASPRALQVMQLAALGTWRYSQGIYRADPDFYHAISESVISDSLPADAFYSLPEWCIYVEAPDLTWCGDRAFGFWAHLDSREDSKYGDLKILFNCERLGYVIGTSIALGPWSIVEGYRKTIQRGAQNMRGALNGLFDDVVMGAALAEPAMMRELSPVISLLLYICSDEPEIEDEKTPGVSPSRPLEKKTKKGPRIFPASQPRIWMLGRGIGETLRAAYEAGPTGTTKRPHLRRGHWHGFWRGARDGERKFGYKWLPPVFVNGRAYLEK